ncbi:hypothetical protein ACWPM1_07615 [Tsuneonella sp. HG249]
MRYEDPAMRAAYLAGALEATEAMILELAPTKVRELQSWLGELGDWTGGPPPQGPHHWQFENDPWEET